MAGRPAALSFAEAVAAAFELGRPVSEPAFAARGELGRVWRLETDEGVWAVKELFETSDADTAAATADVAFQLAARAAGVLAPRPVLGVGGSPVHDVDGRQVRVYEWHDLRPDLGPPPIEEAATALAAIHGLRWPVDGPPHPWFSEPVGELAWQTLLKDARRADARWADAVADLLPDLLRNEEHIAAPPPAALQRCHLDFNLDNLVLDGQRRLVVIDWENSGPADPAQEVASVLVELCGEGEGDAVRRFLEAYGPFEPFGPEVFSLAFAVQGHLLEFYARRRLRPDTTDEDRARSVWRIEEIVRAPLTVSRAERLLAAVP